MNAGRSNSIKISDKTRAILVRKTDSPKNCQMMLARLAPTNFLRPISLVRFAERAVDKFMKLIHAMSRMNIEIKEKMYTYWMAPTG